MAFTPSEIQEVRAAVRRVQTQPCSVCGRADTFRVSEDGFVALRLQEDLQSLQLGGSTLPCIAATCLDCGKTELLNALILGLGHIAERYSPAESRVG